MILSHTNFKTITMEEQNNTGPEPIKPDLKHDTMEYAASADGDDILDSDKETGQEIEDEEITTEELELLMEDDPDNQAAALNSAETDSQADEDNFLNEKESKEELEDDSIDEDKRQRK